LVREALSGDAAVTALYLADDLEPAIAEELAAAAGRRAGGVGVTRVPRDAFARMAHTRHPQGAAAVFAIPATVPIEPGLARWRRIVVANRLADPGNLGTLVRTAEATSCDALLLLGEGCDPWNPKAVRAGMGSHFRVPLVGGLPAERTLRAVSAAGFEVAAAETRGAPSLYDIVFGERVAVLLGGETAGLPFCEGVPFRRFCLPMGGRVDSLNVAQAATAILYELARRGRASCGGA
jgi:TrmH family RNA methyltransferase